MPMKDVSDRQASWLMFVGLVEWHMKRFVRFFATPLGILCIVMFGLGWVIGELL